MEKTMTRATLSRAPLSTRTLAAIICPCSSPRVRPSQGHDSSWRSRRYCDRRWPDRWSIWCSARKPGSDTGGLPCRRLRADITSGAADILALDRAVFESPIRGYILRQADRRRWDIEDHPMDNRLSAVHAGVFGQHSERLRSLGPLGPIDSGGHVVAVLSVFVVECAAGNKCTGGDKKTRGAASCRSDLFG